MNLLVIIDIIRMDFLYIIALYEKPYVFFLNTTLFKSIMQNMHIFHQNGIGFQLMVVPETW